MPEDGVNWVEKSKILTFEEIGRLVHLFSDHGIKNFRLTGGEPLVRQNFVNYVAYSKPIILKFP